MDQIEQQIIKEDREDKKESKIKNSGIKKMQTFNFNSNMISKFSNYKSKQFDNLNDDNNFKNLNNLNNNEDNN